MTIYLNVYFALLWAGMFLFFLPSFYMLKIKDKKLMKKTAKIYFILYVLALLVGTIAEIGKVGNCFYAKLIFDKPWFNASFLVANLSFDNVLINVFMFFPLGFFVYEFSSQKLLLFFGDKDLKNSQNIKIYTYSHSFFLTILISFLASLFIETYQMILPIYRNSELADIVFNTLSGVVSATYFEILFFEKVKINLKKSSKIIC